MIAQRNQLEIGKDQIQIQSENIRLVEDIGCRLFSTTQILCWIFLRRAHRGIVCRYNHELIDDGNFVEDKEEELDKFKQHDYVKNGRVGGLAIKKHMIYFEKFVH